MSEELIVIKGAGEVASGVAYYLFSRGMKVVMTEVSEPTTQRRTVAFAEAVFSDETEVEGVKAKRAGSIEEAYDFLDKSLIPVVVDPEGEIVKELRPKVLVDGIMAKRNTGTSKTDADLVIGLGPGFSAGEDVDVVIETIEGQKAGEVIREGAAQPYTGVPCDIEGYTEERVFRAPTNGKFRAQKGISGSVEKGETIGEVDNRQIRAKISGTIRGLVKSGIGVLEGQKLGDIDPRDIEKFDISDRALKIGEGVWNAIDDYL